MKRLTNEQRKRLERRVIKRFLEEQKINEAKFDFSDFGDFMSGGDDLQPVKETPVVDSVDTNEEFPEPTEEQAPEEEFDYGALKASMEEPGLPNDDMYNPTEEDLESAEEEPEEEPVEEPEEEPDEEPEEEPDEEETEDADFDRSRERKYKDAGHRENQDETELKIKKGLLPMYRSGYFDKDEANRTLGEMGWNLESVKENGTSQFRYVYSNDNYISKANIFVDRNTGRIIGVSVKAD